MSSPSPSRSPESLRSAVASPFQPSYSKNSLQTARQAPSRRHSSTSDRFLQRRDSNASIGGTLDIAGPSTADQVNELSQNAISTLLSPPIVRTGLVPHTSLPTSATYRPPSARDIPPVTLSSIPHVESSAFRSYLAQVGPLFDSFQRAKTANSEAPRRLSTRNKDDAFSEAFSRHLYRKNSASSIKSAKLQDPQMPSPPRTPSSLRTPRTDSTRRSPNIPAPLSTIPAVYFEQNFQLENPRIFDVVSEYAEVIPPDRPRTRDGSGEANGAPKAPEPPRRKALHTNAILQEKLSWYMDTVELHLISSIATASSSFFAALGSLKELEAEAADSIEEIQRLRAALQGLDTDMAVGGLDVVKKRRRRQNIGKLSRAVGQLCQVVEGAKECEEMVDDGDVENATRRIDALEDLIAGRTPTVGGASSEDQRSDLSRIKALDGISNGICELRSRIGKGFEARFTDALLSDLRDHVRKIPPKSTMQRWANTSLRIRGDHKRTRSGVDDYLQNNEQLRPNLKVALAGLSRSGHIAKAASGYRDAVMREIKAMIRKHLPSSSDDDAESVTSVSTRGGRRLNQQEKSAILARNLRALDVDVAEELLIRVYTDIGEALRRLGVQVKILLDVTASMESSQDFRKSADAVDTDNMREEVTQALDLSSLLGQAVDVVQGQIMKVLKVRTDQNIHLPLNNFLRYFILNRLFADECEAVSSQSGEALKSVVNSQVKEFLQLMGDKEKQTINQALELDRWEAKDFGPEQSILLNQILESMTQTPKGWITYPSLWEDDDSIVNGDSASSGQMPRASVNGDAPTPTSPSTATAKPTVRPANLDDQKFLLVPSVYSLMHGITKFMTLISAIPTLAPEASTRLLEYLKLFNSRVCQLVLGAGATKSAGLKNITTKHLALASQACSFIVAVLPYVREFVRRHLASGAGSSVLAEFDRTKRLFQDHQTSIHEKLVEIMGSRCQVAISAFRRAEYDNPSASVPSSWVETLSKETATLHKVLSKHMSVADLKMIMMPIFGEYRREWVGSAEKAMEQGMIKTKAGRSKLQQDFASLAERLGKIDEEEGQNLKSTLMKVIVTQGGAIEIDGPNRFKEHNEEQEKEESKLGHERWTSVDILGQESPSDVAKKETVALSDSGKEDAKTEATE